MSFAPSNFSKIGNTAKSKGCPINEVARLLIMTAHRVQLEKKMKNFKQEFDLEIKSKRSWVHFLNFLLEASPRSVGRQPVDLGFRRLFICEV